jgi:hypothetical protein
MTGYTGEITLRFWTEAQNSEQVHQKINKTLDEWNLATKSDVVWDDVDWTIKQEENA